MSPSEFRQHLPDLSSPRFQVARAQSPYEYVDAFRRTRVPPWLYALTETWEALLQEPFIGITNDGVLKDNLFHVNGNDAELDRSCHAVQKLFTMLDESQTRKIRYPINAREWRQWSNPEFLLRPLGLRLEEQTEAVAQAILSVVEASFSSEGYRKALDAMHINDFLGQICEVPRIMNKYSYNFLVFGEPSVTDAWGWLMYGHHLCLSCFIKESHIEISPTFTGAEPNLIDEGPWAGTQILQEEGKLGLRLMQSLLSDVQAKAQIYTNLRDSKMLQSGDLGVDRWNQDDQRHLCGAFRDNRVVPYEGVRVSDLTKEQQELVLDIAEQFLLYYPKKARSRRKEQMARYFGETFWCWIGGFGDDDSYYFRIQSPVILMEFDHHSGVFLSNKEPAKFHTHTILRTPNGGDYGNALRDLGEKIP